MVTGILLGTLIGGYVLKEVARDSTVRTKLKEWADKAGEKAKKHGEK